MDPYVLKRLWRRPWLSLCSLVLSAVLCFLLCYLSGYQAEQQQKLDETKSSFDILCVVTNRRGTQSVSLRMNAGAYYALIDPEGALPKLIRDLRVTKEFYISCDALELSDAPMIGVTNERCVEDLDPAMGAEVTLFREDFYETEDYVFLMSQEKYDALVEKRMLLAEMEGTEFEEAELLTEIFTFRVQDPLIDPTSGDEWGQGELEGMLGGIYSGSGSDLYISFPASQKLGIEVSNRTSTDSIAFLAADNQRLDAIREAALPSFGTVDPLADEHSSPRYALTIHDEQYNATVAALEQNIQRTRYLLPLVALLGLGMGFLISFLSTRGERMTYALMRTLGLTRGKLFWSILREQMILALLAVVIMAGLTGNIPPAVFYLSCHCVGCCLSVIRSLQVPPTAILREQE